MGREKLGNLLRRLTLEEIDFQISQISGVGVDSSVIKKENFAWKKEKNRGGATLGEKEYDLTKATAPDESLEEIMDEVEAEVEEANPLLRHRSYERGSRLFFDQDDHFGMRGAHHSTVVEGYYYNPRERRHNDKAKKNAEPAERRGRRSKPLKKSPKKPAIRKAGRTRRRVQAKKDVRRRGKVRAGYRRKHGVYDSRLDVPPPPLDLGENFTGEVRFSQGVPQNAYFN